ncbi:MAG: deoxyribodipyrimidine photolyase [Desulfobacteraceae bacterium]|jgi:deoxyribodipyrimidine photo-lyase|nr:MAG: deoxyribodipyrimidine photolyase [Desulfobacteraceae bacterium]
MDERFRLRVAPCNKYPVRRKGAFVLYWMTAFRRTHWNFGLERAVMWASELKKPLLILEALRCDYPWASDRFHRFIIDGMAENESALKGRSAAYYPYIEHGKGEGKGLLEALSDKAAVVVTDDYPAFFLPRMVSSAAQRIPVLMEKVDSNGLIPMRAGDKVFPTAYAFRRFLQKSLPHFLKFFPAGDPLDAEGFPSRAEIPDFILKRWPRTDFHAFAGDSKAFRNLPLDHGVKPVARPGGEREASRLLKIFLENGLADYPEKRREPQEQGTSGLSPFLHFGHVSSHGIFLQVAQTEEWFFDRLSSRAIGSKSNWWGMSEGAEAFLDQLVTWRELGFNMCFNKTGFEGYESLPPWAIATLEAHSKDERPYLYGLDILEKGQTHDALWNAAQKQLVHEGTIHNYLRMLWGKKILQWSPDPRSALSVMIELNNKYALDGRDPNSYSGIFWVLGRYDRPWGPERPVFGKVRYMSSENTARKVPVRDYIKKFKGDNAVA